MAERRLRISDELSLPLEAVSEPMGILAARRAGKSNAAVVLAEEMFDAGLHWVAIDPKGDWWGIRGAGDGEGPGLPIPILGGSHGDIPLEPGAGAMIADLIVDEHLTCLLDVSGFASEAEKIRFLLAFGDRLFRRKEQSQEPTHVFFEEADDYVPQRAFPEQQRLVHVMSRILKQGGSRGLGGTVISQRSAVVHKDILSQVQTLFALRTTGTQDRKAVRDWVSFSGENPDVVASLSELADGEAWIWSPAWLRTTKRFQFRRRRTFDSGATPKIGATRRPPATIADVDLGALQTRMAATIEKAKADDPKELRKRIRELERQATANVMTTFPPQPEVVVERIEVPVLNGQVDELRAVVQDLVGVGERVANVGTAIIDAIGRASRPTASGGRPATMAARVAVAPAPAAPRREPVPHDVLEYTLRPTERAILNALAQWPQGRSQRQVAILTGYSPKSGGFFGALSSLRKLDAITGGSGLLQITDRGREGLGDYDPLPIGDALREHWYAKLPKAEATILRVLVDAFPAWLSQEELSERTGYSGTSGGFFGALAKLRTLELITGGRSGMQASEELF